MYVCVFAATKKYMEKINKHACVNAWTEGWLDACMHGWTEGWNECMHACMHVRTEGQTDG